MNVFINTQKIRLMVLATSLGMLTGCVVTEPRPGRAYYSQPAPVEIVDDYVYYPNYEVYFSSRTHSYVYLEGNVWVTRPAPPHVSIDILLNSPSIRLGFHDSPARHHAKVVREYPRNWTPPGNRRGDKDNRPNGNG